MTKVLLLVNDDLEHGGVQRIVVHLANLASGVGWNVHVLSNGGALEKHLAESVQRHRWNSQRFFLRAKQLRGLVKSTKCVVVHTHQRRVSLAAWLAARRNAKVLEHVHNSFDPGPIARLGFRAQILIACAPHIAEMLTRDFNKSPSQVRLVMNGVPDLSSSDGLALRSSTRTPRRLRVINVARLDEQKDPLHWLRLVAALHKSDMLESAVWVGDGPLANAFNDEVRRLGLGCVSSTGFVEDVKPYYFSADLFLMSSKWEGLPLTALEALSTSLPVVLPNVGSCSSAVRANKNGLLYEKSDPPEQVAAHLVSALEATSFERWGAESRQLYEERFRIALFDQAMLKLYEEEEFL